MKKNFLLKNKINKVHFTGIKGVGMTALALAFKDFGYEVYGSDIEEAFVTDNILRKEKIKIYNGFKKENIKDIDLLIYTAAHQGRDNIEVLAAEKRKIPVVSHAEALGWLMKQKKVGISVAGVGGKTTTSSMLAAVLEQSRLYPSWVVGAGEIYPLIRPGRYRHKGIYFIAEADEYFTSPQEPIPRFFFQKPLYIILTNLAYDHPDVYKNIKQTLNTFKKFISSLPKKGRLFLSLDNPLCQKLANYLPSKTITYGFNKKADWQIRKNGEFCFDISYKRNFFSNIELKLKGDFNMRNATAVFSLAYNLGIKENDIKKGLKFFEGVKRRFQLIKCQNGICLYDDYAHHPLQIKETLKAAQLYLKPSRLIVIFQPHTYSRTKALIKDFASSFEEADLVIITEIYLSAREKKMAPSLAPYLCSLIKKNKVNSVFLRKKNEVVNFLKKTIRKGDVIFTLGAGDIYNWQEDLCKVLK